MKEQWFDTMYNDAKEIATLVGFKIEDVQRDKAQGCGYMDHRLVKENRQSFCYWLLNFIGAEVEERWEEYPDVVRTWYELASNLESEATFISSHSTGWFTLGLHGEPVDLGPDMKPLEKSHALDLLC